MPEGFTCEYVDPWAWHSAFVAADHQSIFQSANATERRTAATRLALIKSARYCINISTYFGAYPWEVLSVESGLKPDKWSHGFLQYLSQLVLWANNYEVTTEEVLRELDVVHAESIGDKQLHTWRRVIPEGISAKEVQTAFGRLKSKHNQG
jgi:hypothetical protein